MTIEISLKRVSFLSSLGFLVVFALACASSGCADQEPELGTWTETGDEVLPPVDPGPEETPECDHLALESVTRLENGRQTHVAADADGFLIAWKTWTNETHLTKAQAYGTDGTPKSAPFLVHATENGVQDIAGTADGFLILSSGMDNVGFRTRLTSDGTFVGRDMSPQSPWSAARLSTDGQWMAWNGMSPTWFYTVQVMRMQDGTSSIWAASQDRIVDSTAGIAQNGNAVAVVTNAMEPINQVRVIVHDAAPWPHVGIITEYHPDWDYAAAMDIYAVEDGFAVRWFHGIDGDTYWYLTYLNGSGDVEQTYALPAGVTDLQPYGDGYVASMYDWETGDVQMALLGRDGAIIDRVAVAAAATYIDNYPRLAVSGDHVALYWGSLSNAIDPTATLAIASCQ